MHVCIAYIHSMECHGDRHYLKSSWIPFFYFPMRPLARYHPFHLSDDVFMNSCKYDNILAVHTTLPSNFRRSTYPCIHQVSKCVTLTIAEWTAQGGPSDAGASWSASLCQRYCADGGSHPVIGAQGHYESCHDVTTSRLSVTNIDHGSTLW